MPVDRCVCFNVSFAQLKEFAQAHACGLEGLRERFGCGRGCALCVPYIERMLRTGQTMFTPDSNPMQPPDSL